MNQPVIHIRGLNKSFGDNHVLRGVDLDVHARENLVVLGRSGTGKSVLIKIVIGLLEPDAGTVEVLGQDVHALGRRDLDALRQRIGFCFQHSALYDSMTVEENLRFPLAMNQPDLPESEVVSRIEEVLDAVGLPRTRRQMPAELSGGQQKRIGIARTLILRPEIVLYDEPTSGLDPATCTEINDLILSVRERFGTASIVITHDLTCAREVGDRVAVLLDGEVARQGTFDSVFATENPRIRAFYDYNFTENHP